MVHRPYLGRLERLTICRCHCKGSTFSSVILRPWVLVRSGARTRDLPHGKSGAPPIELTRRRSYSLVGNRTHNNWCRLFQPFYYYHSNSFKMFPRSPHPSLEIVSRLRWGFRGQQLKIISPFITRMNLQGPRRRATTMKKSRTFHPIFQNIKKPWYHLTSISHTKIVIRHWSRTENKWLYFCSCWIIKNLDCW